MIMTSHRSLWQTLYHYKVHHVILWILYFIFWTLAYMNMYPLWDLLTTIVIYFVFTATSFYLTSYRLIPRLLLRRRIGLFMVLFLVMLVALAVLQALLLQYHFERIPGAMQFPARAFFWMSLISIITMTGLASGAKLLVDKIRSDRQTKVLEQQRLESELQYLKAQVNPHFLFNAINSVYILIHKDPARAAETLIKLSDLLRFQLYDTSGDLIPIEKEIDYLTNYVALEKLRRGDKVQVSFDATGVSGFHVAPFLMIPLLENAFKHISTGPAGTNRIEGVIRHADGKLTASFYNTVDTDPVAAPVGGIGLKNLRRRLELLYPGTHSLTLHGQSGSYSATLEIHTA